MQIESRANSDNSDKEVPVCDLPMYPFGWEVVRQSVGDDAFVALIADDMGTRVVAAVKDGPKDLEAVQQNIVAENPDSIFDWIVLPDNHILLQGRQDRQVTLYGGGGPMNLTGVQMVSFENPEEADAANAALVRLTQKAVHFVQTLQSTA